ncbi:hypothetical protein NGM37_25265, partial [Streptomyces sp. TRM76130]|nr:hypothetical protein [Streptomyces sp. TRM76130]
MHMNSVPQHLSSEDRQEYERLLNEALRSAPHRPELAAVGRRLSPEQLRAMALSATALITTAAATEYQHYVKVREALRHPAPSTSSSSARQPGPARPGTYSAGITTTLGEATETAGAGAGAVITVLALVLTGTATAVFLLIGYVLQAVAPDRAFTRTMLTTGWAFGALTAIAILVAAVGLLTTALRNHPSAEAATYGERDGEVQQAR